MLRKYHSAVIRPCFHVKNNEMSETGNNVFMAIFYWTQRRPQPPQVAMEQSDSDLPPRGHSNGFLSYVTVCCKCLSKSERCRFCNFVQHEIAGYTLDRNVHRIKSNAVHPLHVHCQFSNRKKQAIARRMQACCCVRR